MKYTINNLVKSSCCDLDKNAHCLHRNYSLLQNMSSLEHLPWLFICIFMRNMHFQLACLLTGISQSHAENERRRWAAATWDISTEALGSWDRTAATASSELTTSLSSTSVSVAVPGNMLQRCMFSRSRHIPKHYPEIAGVIAAQCLSSAHARAWQGGYIALVSVRENRSMLSTMLINIFFKIYSLSVLQPSPQNTWSLKSPSTAVVKHKI